MKPCRVGIIGFGYTGRLHARAWELNGGQVIAVADPNRALASGIQQPAKLCEDALELLASDVDCVSICVPTWLHHRMTLDSLAAGKHVLVEKPIAVDMREAHEMLDAARSAGKQLYVGMTHRFYPELREAKSRIEAGEIGEIVSCNDSIIEHFGFLESPGWYLDRRLSGGGTVLTSGIHLIDRLRWFTGEDVTHVAGSASNPYFGSSVEDSAQMHLRFSSGLTAQVTFAWTREEHPLVCDLQLLGSAGSLTVHTWSGYDVHTASGTTTRTLYTTEPHQEKVLVGIAAEVREFCKSIQEQRDPWPSAEESTKALEVVMAFYRAVETGKFEPVPH
jgi:myo-inositol 2-dehydrogenase/D-chiro-inositol 1-dehydrogenase